MLEIESLKNKIMKCLVNLERHTLFTNRAGHFDHNKGAEEFYRGLLSLFFGWNLENLNTKDDPNYEGADLGDIEKKIAVQVTSENTSKKVHDSIIGFKNKSIKDDGYKELYILMFKGKTDFPRADFAKTVDGAFSFDKSKHIIDNSDLAAKLKDAEFDYVKKIYDYLNKTIDSSYLGIDEEIDDLVIINEIFDYIQENIAVREKSYSDKSEAFVELKKKVSLNFPENKRNRLSEIFKNTSIKKNIVEKYLKNIDNETKLFDLREFIQQSYCDLKKTDNHEARINDIGLINDLALKLLPENRRSNISYQANAKAIVLYFFEFCDIGKKTETEKMKMQSLFD